ncbi:MAG: hypothetical protein O2955_19510 [Planctomycetota bacterium]|nr:hypothetical protein [Planctomycetota bacterium]MDA1214702.1 hypothetical protein [Planctomycetota bacterium]
MRERESRQTEATLRDELEQRLKVFEECTETPFVPGELEQWLSAEREAFRQLVPILKQSSVVHVEEFAEIADEDPELLVRVDAMREEDDSIAEFTDEVSHQLDAFPEAMIDGGDETKFKDDLDQFVSDALELLIRIRKQEVTVRTWMSEAFNRDRGTQD